MISAVEDRHPLTAAEPNVDSFPSVRANDHRIGLPHAGAAAQTVRLQGRRRTFPESPPICRRSNCGRVAKAVDNFALRELSCLALFL